MTTVQVTENDRERAVTVCPLSHALRMEPEKECYGCLKIASELAAARREGEIAEHKRICKQCKWGVFEEPVKCKRLKQLEGGE